MSAGDNVDKTPSSFKLNFNTRMLSSFNTMVQETLRINKHKQDAKQGKSTI